MQIIHDTVETKPDLIKARISEAGPFNRNDDGRDTNVVSMGVSRAFPQAEHTDLTQVNSTFYQLRKSFSLKLKRDVFQ